MVARNTTTIYIENIISQIKELVIIQQVLKVLEKKIEDNLPSVEEALKNLKQVFEDVVKAEDKMIDKLKEFGLLK